MNSEYVMKKTYWINMIAIGSLIAALYLTIGYIAFSIYDTRPPLIIYSATVTRDTFKRGEPIEIRWDVEKRRVCEGDISRVFIDSENKVTQLSTPAVPRLPEGRFNYVGKVPFPPSLPPGDYTYVASAIWKCNPFRTIYQKFGSIDVKVVE